jgi:MFS transporter, DHA1 family, multidrug resistance protein
VVASLACALAQSLPTLLICRFVQGIGAASTAMTFAIVCDLFGETSARTKIANVVIAINVVTVIAPTAGAALLTIGGWRLIYMIQAGIGALLLLALVLGFAESARIDPANRLAPALAIRSYRRTLRVLRAEPSGRGEQLRRPEPEVRLTILTRPNMVPVTTPRSGAKRMRHELLLPRW